MSSEGVRQQRPKRSAVAEVARGVFRWRKRRGLTVEQVAQRSGVPTVVLLAIEGDQHDPAIDLLDGLADALMVRLVCVSAWKRTLAPVLLATSPIFIRPPAASRNP